MMNKTHPFKTGRAISASKRREKPAITREELGNAVDNYIQSGGEITRMQEDTRPFSERPQHKDDEMVTFDG